MKTKLPTQREYILNLDCNFKPEKASYSYTSAKLTFCHLTLSNSMGFTYSKQPPKCVLLSMPDSGNTEVQKKPVSFKVKLALPKLSKALLINYYTSPPVQ